MAKTKITPEQCKAAFAEVSELLGDDGTWHLNPAGGQYVVAKTQEGGAFNLIYKPLGPSSFVHCCEFAKALLQAQAGVDVDEEEDDEDDEESEEDEILAEEDEEDEEDEKPAPRARSSQK